MIESEHRRIDFYLDAAKRQGYHHSECSCGKWNFYSPATNAMVRAAKLRAGFNKHVRQVKDA
jgi:hypothetical protein